MVDIAWVFFAANGLKNALGIFVQMFKMFQTTSIYDLGLSRGNWVMLLFALGILLLVDIMHELGKSVFKEFNKQKIWFRWSVYIGLIWIVILFGIYGIGYDVSQFIYFQF